METTIKLNTSRLLLAKLRGGDYAHAGEEEAIEMVITKLKSIDPTITTKPTLDVGSGFGGTANFFFKQGFHNIQGIDIDPSAIQYAKLTYPPIPFVCGDALDIDKFHAPGSISLVYMFNVSYVFQDKNLLLTKLSSITHKGGLIVLFDYAQINADIDSKLLDLANKPMYPIPLNIIQSSLKDTGWEMLEMIDMTEHYIRWYHDLLKKLDITEPDIQTAFQDEDLQKVKRVFSSLFELLKQGQLKGTLIYARKL